MSPVTRMSNTIHPAGCRPGRDAAPQARDEDMCVYGANSGGVIAAIAAARQGRTVILIEPGRHLGGMTSGGLGLTDHGEKAAIGGLSREFYRRVAAHYRQAGTPLDDQRQGPGWSHEPHVAERVFEDWVKEYPIAVIREHRLASVIREGRRLLAIGLDHAPPDERGAPAAAPLRPNALRVAARMFIDASYEGDLMARAGVSYTTRRESRGQYGESLAGIRHRPGDLAIDPYVRPGRPESRA